MSKLRFILMVIICFFAVIGYGNEPVDTLLKTNTEGEAVLIGTEIDSINPAVVRIDTAILLPPIDASEREQSIFKPNPQKSVWYALLFPGLGQIYNRRYWKLPIVYGGFAGLAYAISWNGKYYKDYARAYRDIMDTNSKSKSYENLLPYGTDPNSQWAKDLLKQKQDSYRRYRDLSIIGTVAFFALTVVDAFVDAQLADFDISPDLSMRVTPAVIPQETNMNASVGMQLQLKF
ncbi:MAG: hypothetical protein EOM76_03420 [Sphingobacteriia bacterium]|jgi:hypothetical protein|nr:DUF5683 domain-containing protein [Paludibacteraceae bacterium]NCA79225.1 hypothetical protein [Sphingobacteriia bacterium]